MGKPTLLYAEDDIKALENTIYLLKKYFSKIYSAVDGLDAFDSYIKHDPDIILLDINIPKLNGLELASKIREKDNETPIILLTAHSEKKKLLKAIDLQISSYIIKPFKIQELKDNITKVLKRIEISNNKVRLDNNFSWNTNSYELFYKDTQIALTKNEILLIKILIENRSRFLTSSELSLEICTSEEDITGHNTTQLISRFKKKISKQINSDYFFIENIYGSGYRIK